jgi:hypothetical protein
VLDEKYYQHLKGGIMEAFGKLFPGNVKMYIYPSLDNTGELSSIQNIKVPDQNKYLLKHLTENRKIIDITNVNTKRLNIFSSDVLERIQHGDPTWEEMVPRFIVDFIKRKQLFGYRENN